MCRRRRHRFDRSSTQDLDEPELQWLENCVHIVVASAAENVFRILRALWQIVIGIVLLLCGKPPNSQ
jgi:hypothetical protein